MFISTKIPEDIEKYIYTFIPKCIQCHKISWYKCDHCESVYICSYCWKTCQVCSYNVCCYVHDVGGKDIVCHDCYLDYLFCYI
jgi:hypothetical protein